MCALRILPIDIGVFCFEYLTTSQAAAPGRCIVSVEALSARHPAISRINVNSRRSWRKENQKVLMECYLKAEMEGLEGLVAGC